MHETLLLIKREPRRGDSSFYYIRYRNTSFSFADKEIKNGTLKYYNKFKIKASLHLRKKKSQKVVRPPPPPPLISMKNKTETDDRCLACDSIKIYLPL